MSIKPDLTPPPLTLSQVLVAPFRALLLGHVLVLSYTAFGIIALYCLLTKAQTLIHSLVVSLELPRYYGSINSLETVLVLLLWSLLIPVTISLTAVPIRSIWLTHRVGIRELWAWTLPAIRKTAQAILASAKALTFLIIPLVSIIVLHRMLRENDLLPIVGNLFYILGAAVAVLVLFRGIGVLFSVLISVCTGVRPEIGLVISNEMIKSKLLHLCVIALVALSTVLMANLLFRYLVVDPNWSTRIQIYLIVFTSWYCLSSFCVLALEISEEYVRRRGRTFRPELMAESSRIATSRYEGHEL